MRVASDGNPLPNARFLSNELSETTNGNSFGSTSSFMSVYVMQMGQFLDHDFAHSPNFPQQTCCDENIENRDEQCIPIDIPSDDPFFSNIINPDTNLPEPVTCMRMARAMTSPDLDCPMDIERQQVTSIHTY